MMDMNYELVINQEDLDKHIPDMAMYFFFCHLCMYLGSHWPFQYIQFMLFVILHAFLFLEKISWVFYLEQSVRLLFILGDKKSRFLQTLHSCLFCCCLSRYVMKKNSALACYAAVYLSIFIICLAGAMHAFPSGLQSAARRSVATVTR